VKRHKFGHGASDAGQLGHGAWLTRPVIGISMLTLVPGIVGGSETYARELCKALARVGRLEYHAYVPTIAPDAGDGLPTSVVEGYRASRSMPGRIAAMSRAAAAPGRLRRALRASELDAIHFPLSVMLPPLDTPPAATTVLDVQHEVFPEFFSRAELAYRRRVYGWTVRKSRIVITISEHARAALVDRLDLDPKSVRAIYLAVDHERFRPDSRQREPFLLYPANAWQHKNHARLFEAFAAVRRKRPELRLVLTGAGHDRLTLPDGAESRGHVGLDELVALYRSAAALVYPSLYEGFGIPCVEAMACGCPVAASDVASLPEVCGDAAVYFDPLDPESIAEGIRRVLDSPLPGGQEQAARFTWERCAREHDSVYEELVATA
jgi:glycosyltransferase involved in cell wall biosynthesis